MLKASMPMINCIRPSPMVRRITTNKVWCSSAPDQRLAQPPSRRVANYQPNSWDYGSIQSLGGDKYGSNMADPSSFNKLKVHVRDLLLRDDEPLQKLKVIDTMQRLGFAYQFEEEISDILYSISIQRPENNPKDDVLFTTLFFRLIRQLGFPTSSELLLARLEDGKGNLKRTLHTDVKGLLSLYEASHLAFDGEDLLDEGRVFSAKALRERIPSIQPHLRSSVAHALALPLHWRAPRNEARWFINYYAGDNEADPLMLHFAKLDFNNVQNVHQRELASTTCWWKDAALNEKLPFARDRLMECFYFASGIASEPSLGACREVVTKVFALIVLLDDIYDIYGTLDELIMFTDAIGRWEAFASEELPDYMKAIYCTILDTTNKVADHVFVENCCGVYFLLRTAWHDLCKAFLVEAKWHNSNYKPSLQEYLDNGWVSVSGPLMLLHAFPMLKMDITQNSTQQLESYPRLVQLVSKIFRLCNDSATHSEELKRGDAPSSIAIYMAESGATEVNSRKAMTDLTMEIWKMVNRDAYDNCQYPASFANACMNMARISHCIYQGGDGIGAPDDNKKMEITELFLQPFIIENDNPFY